MCSIPFGLVALYVADVWYVGSVGSLYSVRHVWWSRVWPTFYWFEFNGSVCSLCLCLSRVLVSNMSTVYSTSFWLLGSRVSSHRG
jgi:hypothetical protein